MSFKRLKSQKLVVPGALLQNGAPGWEKDFYLVLSVKERFAFSNAVAIDTLFLYEGGHTVQGVILNCDMEYWFFLDS